MSASPRATGPAVEVHPDFGRAAPALGWVPAPRYLLRRDRILAWMREMPRGRVVEIGCGAGSLLADLSALGFSCTAVETSEAARELARKILSDQPEVAIESAPDRAWRGSFDYLLAFEVLEHIPDDAAALSEWMEFVRPGGALLLSVPAHAHRWTATDTWAGHVRRYDRGDFVALVERCGARVLRCDNYGFPLANMIEPAAAWARRRQRSPRRDDAAAARSARTEQSGVSRSVETRLYPLMRSLPGRWAMRAAFAAQRRFARTELGNGFLLLAVRR